MVVDIFGTDKKYDVIYADPPWTFKTYSPKGTEKKSAQSHYVTAVVRRLTRPTPSPMPVCGELRTI